MRDMVEEATKKARTPDPRVATAIAHWAPRFVSNGVLLADFEEIGRASCRERV